MGNFFGFLNKNAKERVEEDVSDKRIVVNAQRCPQNHPCPSVQVCPAEALSQKGFDAPTVDMDKCIKCGKCVKHCPRGAISLIG